MTTLEKIRAEFISRYPKNYTNEPELGGASCVFSLNEVLQIIDKYASEECDRDCEHCAYIECPKEPSECQWYECTWIECPKGGEQNDTI